MPFSVVNIAINLEECFTVDLFLAGDNYGLPIAYGRPYCNDAKEGVGGITPPKLNRGG